MEENKAVKSSRFKRVCVFCGSSSGKRNCYRDAALELGKELVLFHSSMPSSRFLSLFCLKKRTKPPLISWLKVSRRLDLVYGGGSVGLMGLVSQEVHRGGGHVLGYQTNTYIYWLINFFFTHWIRWLIFFSFIRRIIPKTLMSKEVVSTLSPVLVESLWEMMHKRGFVLVG